MKRFLYRARVAWGILKIRYMLWRISMSPHVTASDLRLLRIKAERFLGKKK
jgi:hypothetical protein